MFSCLQDLMPASGLQTPRRSFVAALQVLTEELGGLVGALSFTRSMRWNSSTAFSRPVRWLLALHGSTVLPFSFAGLQAGGSDFHVSSISSVVQQPFVKRHFCAAFNPVSFFGNFHHAIVDAAHIGASVRSHYKGAMAASWRPIVQAGVIPAALR